MKKEEVHMTGKEKGKTETHSAHTPGDTKMKKAYELANALVRDRLKSEDAENLALLDTISGEDVVVVDGTYDHIHLVLESIGLPFLRVDHNGLMKLLLRPDQTVFVNCASNFPAEGARKLATFVAKGGQLITTDWALKNVLEAGFPGVVQFNGKPTGDEVVRIEIVDKDDPAIAGFIDEESAPVWWLEGSSYPVKILDQERVRVLVRSKELGERYGEEAVIVRFQHGEGTVYHMISHFYLQRTETREAGQKQKASAYAGVKGASAGTMAAWEAAEQADPNLDYGSVQAANTSVEFVSRTILKQKKKFKK